MYRCTVRWVVRCGDVLVGDSDRVTEWLCVFDECVAVCSPSRSPRVRQKLCSTKLYPQGSSATQQYPQGTCSTEQYGLKTRAGCCGTECFWICEPPKTAAVQGANSKNRQQSCCPQRTATCRCCRRACGGHCVPQPPRSQPRQLCLRRSQRHRPSRPRPRLDADLDQRYV